MLSAALTYASIGTMCITIPSPSQNINVPSSLSTGCDRPTIHLWHHCRTNNPGLSCPNNSMLPIQNHQPAMTQPPPSPTLCLTVHHPPTPTRGVLWLRTSTGGSIYIQWPRPQRIRGAHTLPGPHRRKILSRQTMRVMGGGGGGGLNF